MKPILLLSLGLTLSACAPAMLGRGTLNPLVSASNTAPVKVLPGETVYVQYTYPRGIFTISDERYAHIFVSTGSGSVGSQESPAYWLGMSAEGLPAGWQVTLAEAAVRKEVVASTLQGDTISYRYYERVRVVYKITLPADARGSAFALLKFKDGGAEIGVAPLMINAGDASGPSVGAQF
ncbi:hypothetical protein [Deinococcus sp.]|uniref:hypothetical protein n=1 Tax=Deinococcus sp. TaxID=47478 RepID=UPI003C7B2C55